MKKRALDVAFLFHACGVAALLPSFRLARTAGAFAVQTATFQLKSPEQPLLVDLISVIHVADAAYFHGLQRESQSYDRLLFELVVDSSVISADDRGLRRINALLGPTPEQIALARRYGLCAQLECIDYSRWPHWVLADLSRQQLVDLNQEKGKTGSVSSQFSDFAAPAWLLQLREAGQALSVGRVADGRVLPRFFFLSGLDGGALLLRGLLWLCPCPEAEMLLLDWARAYPRAGGPATVLSAMADSVLAGDFLTARKLGFAQQLVSSQALNLDDSATASTAALTAAAMAARNAAAVAAVERAAQDGCRRVGVLYGGRHMREIRRALQESPELTMELTGVQWRTAWSVPLPQTQTQLQKAGSGSGVASVVGGAATEAEERSKDSDNPTLAELVWRHRALLVLAAGYVGLGAWDWADSLTRVAAALERRDLAGGAAVLGLYVARHAWLYLSLAKSFVQWDQQLF